MPPTPLQIFPLQGLAEVKQGDNLAALIAAADFRSLAGDIFVVAQKIVSKAEGAVVALDSIVPSERAAAWAKTWDRDPRAVELVLRESKRILRMERGIIVAETHHGYVCANAGIDLSNAADGTAILLPQDPDASARALQTQLQALLGVSVGVIVADTFGRAWREGLVNVALGVAGFAPFTDYRGEKDSGGKLLQASLIASADEIASAAELVMGKLDRVPVAVVRGFHPRGPEGTGRDLIRPEEKDLFR